MHNTLSNICCVGVIRCCVGGLPYTTHFQIYNVCFVGSNRCCVRGVVYINLRLKRFFNYNISLFLSHMRSFQLSTTIWRPLPEQVSHEPREARPAKV